MSELYIGVMSGTSLDAVDISLCEISENDCKEITSDDYAYGSLIKQDILKAISEPLSLKEVKIAVTISGSGRDIQKHFNQTVYYT